MRAPYPPEGGNRGDYEEWEFITRKILIINMKQFARFLFAFTAFALFVPQLHVEGGTADILMPHLAFAAGAGIVYTLLPLSNVKNVFPLGIQVEIWAKYIIERFWKDNAFLKNAFSDDDKVLAGHVVHIPQPGSKPLVVKNRNSFPATTVQRTDTDITYVLDEYTTDPTHIQDAEKVEVSYDKIDSVLGDHMSTLSEAVADDLLIKWAPALARFVRTTGADTAGTGAQTGTRKAMMGADLKKAALLMNLDNVPKNDRFALCDSNMLDQLTSQLTDTLYRDFSSYYDAKNGVIGRLHGFDIIDRSAVLNYAVGNTVKALGAAGAATDNLASLCWQKNSVARAMGEVKLFQRINDPLYYGDIYSCLLRMGGRIRRANAEGIVAIVQDPTGA